MQRTRVELAVLLRQAAPTDLPPEFAPAADAGLSGVDRSFVVVLTRVLGPRRLQAYADMLRDLPDDPVGPEFDDLPADADEPTRRDVAERLAPYIGALRAQHPGLDAPHSDATHGRRFVEQTVGRAMRDLYNPAQLDVLQRVRILLGLPPRTDRPDEDDDDEHHHQHRHPRPTSDRQQHEGRGRPADAPGVGP